MPCDAAGLEDRRAGRDGDGLPVDRQLDRRRRLGRRRRRRARRPGRRVEQDRRDRPCRRGGGQVIGSQRHQLRPAERALDRRARRLAEAADRSRRASPGRSRRGAPAPSSRSPRGRAVASRASSSSWRTVPTRHGTHWPHDSSRKKRAIRRSVPTMSAVSSKTMTTPGSERRPDRPRRLERQRRVERVGPDEDAGRAAEQHGLERRGRRGRRRRARSARRSVAPNSTS